MLSHKSLHNSGKSFFSISMTLAWECGPADAIILY